MNTNQEIASTNNICCNHTHDEIIKYSTYRQTNPRIIKIQKQLVSAGPYYYFGTLSFQYDLDPTDARIAASIHWRRVQKYILGKNWIRKKIEPMTGIIVMETHPIYSTKTTHQFSNCHFHHLIYNHPKFSKNHVMTSIQLDNAFSEAACNLTHKNKRWQLVSKYGTRVLPIDTTMNICGYTAKEAWDHNWKWEERIGYLSRDGLT